MMVNCVELCFYNYIYFNGSEGFDVLNLRGRAGVTVGFSPIFLKNRVAKKMRTYFEMGTDGHRFLCF